MNIPDDDTLEAFSIVTENVIKYLYNSSEKDFISAFGKSDADYFWTKFTELYKCNEGDFFCYLDPNNKLKIMRDVFLKYGKESQ